MGKSPVQDRDLMLDCAILYYEHRMKQGDIAKKFGLSQGQVSKLITEALTEGHIRLIVERPEHSDLEQVLLKKFDFLHHVRMVPASDDRSLESDGMLKRTLGMAAAQYLQDMVWDSAKIGIAGGTTLYQLVM